MSSLEVVSLLHDSFETQLLGPDELRKRWVGVDEQVVEKPGV